MQHYKLPSLQPGELSEFVDIDIEEQRLNGRAPIKYLDKSSSNINNNNELAEMIDFLRVFVVASVVMVAASLLANEMVQPMLVHAGVSPAFLS